MFAIRSYRVLLTLSTALVVAMPTAMFSAPPAWAVPATPVITAVGAPDGVFVFWGPDRLVSHRYKLLESVEGVTTEHDVWGVTYADRSLEPGQQATYRVVAIEDGEQSAESTPVTAARLEQDWTEPQGARTESVEGEVDANVGNSPFLNSSPGFALDTDGKTRLTQGGMAFARFSGPGTFELATDPTPGQVGFTAPCSPGGADSGSALVHDVVYGASGMPLQLGADFAWHCESGTSHRLTMRFHSPASMAHVVLEPPTRDFVVQGLPATATWHLRNLGDAPATIGAIAASGGQDVSSPCSGVVLAGGAECAISMDMSEPVTSTPGGYGFSLSARVADQPGAAIWHNYVVYVPLVAPKLAIDGRLPGRVQLSWGASPDGTQPLEALRIERQRGPGLPWATVAQPNPATDSLWVDDDVVPGMAPNYRIIALAQDGSTSDPSEPLPVTVPSAGLVWPAGPEVRGGSRPEDPDSVSVLSWPSFPGNGTGVDVSPDRSHVAVTTYTPGTNTNRLLLTDVNGASVQVLDANTNGNAGSSRPFFSPDGKRLAYETGHGWSGTVSVLDIATKTRRDVLNQGTLYGWSPDGTKVLLADGINKYGDPVTGLRWVNLADDNYTAIAGTASVPHDDTTYKQSVDVSRTGQIVWVSHAAAGDVLMRTGPSAGSPTTLWAPTGCLLGEPRFDPRGAVLSIGIGGGGCSAGAGGTVTLAVPATGTAAVSSKMLRFAPQGPPQWFAPTSVAPTVAIAVPPVSSASATATITTSDADDAVGGLARMCRLDVGAWKVCGATLKMTALAAGRHTLTARATDPSGHASADSLIAWVVDTTPPTTSLAAVSNPLLNSSLTLHWTGTDAGGSSVANYDIRDRYAASGGGFGAFHYPATWQHRTTPSLKVGVSQGYTYCFSVRTRDRVGNVGKWSSERCTMVAYDDRAMAVSGPYRGSSSSYMYGTYTRTVAAGQTLSRKGISARRVGIVAAVCSTCGALDVWLGGVKIGNVNTNRSTTKGRQVLWLPIQKTTRTGSLVLRSSSSRSVYVDGVVLQK